MKITRIETRHPFTVAVELAEKSGKLTDQRRDELKRAIYDLVVDSTSKFVGFANLQSVRKGLDIVIGVLSFHLLHSTKGKQEFDAWVDFVLTGNLKNAVGDVVRIIKAQAALSKYSEQCLGRMALIEGITERGELLKYAQWRGQHGKGPWSGYGKYLSDAAASREQTLSIDLATWLVREFLKMPVSRWNKTFVELLGSEDLVPRSEEVINNIIFHHCANLEVGVNLILKKKDFASARKAYEKNKSVWTTRAKERYTELLKKMPPEFHPLMIRMGQSWIERNLKKGPPILPKKWDEAGAPMKGLTGVYACETIHDDW